MIFLLCLSAGILKKWQLILYGTDINPVRYRSRSLNTAQAQTPQNFGIPTGVPGGQAQYRPAPPLPLSQQAPRFIPQDYLLPGASENIPQVQKPQMVRSQCKNEYWIPDLSVCVNGCPEGYFGGEYFGLLAEREKNKLYQFPGRGIKEWKDFMWKWKRFFW